MSKGMAVAIFKDIYTTVATEEEKMESIKMVLSMGTHNGIRKQDFINVLRYLMGCTEKTRNQMDSGEKETNRRRILRGHYERSTCGAGRTICRTFRI